VYLTESSWAASKTVKEGEKEERKVFTNNPEKSDAKNAKGIANSNWEVLEAVRALIKIGLYVFELRSKFVSAQFDSSQLTKIARKTLFEILTKAK